MQMVLKLNAQQAYMSVCLSVHIQYFCHMQYDAVHVNSK